MGTREGTAPCFNPACEHRTFVRIYGATYDEPGSESTDCCEKCGEHLDLGEFEYEDGYDDPNL